MVCEVTAVVFLLEILGDVEEREVEEAVEAEGLYKRRGV